MLTVCHYMLTVYHYRCWKFITIDDDSLSYRCSQCVTIDVDSLSLDDDSLSYGC